ncbi:MAG: Flp pilus assembly protein CpaB [Planctomycetes bacterium]|nr:Flp pilus assembly protein CpaB [Planctomycetota bacterium]
MKNMIAIVIAAGLGAVAVFFVSDYINNKINEEVGPKKPMVVVRMRIAAGSEIKPDFIMRAMVPTRGLSTDAVSEADMTRVLSQRVRIDLEPNTILRWIDLEQATAEGNKWSGRIATGKRAVTLPIDELSGIAGRLLPGDKVDIMLTYVPFDNQTGIPGTKSKITYMMSEASILDLGGYMTKGVSGVTGALGELLGPKAYSTVTFEVTPSDAELLVYAQTQGKMHFVLRNPKEPSGISGVGPIDADTFDSFVKARGTGK